MSSDLIELRRTVPVAVAAARAEARSARGDDASDGGDDVACALAATADPWRDAVEIDTSGTPEDAVAAALAALAA